MRRSVLLLAPLAATAALFACEADSTTPAKGQFTPEAGTFQPPPTPDGSAPEAPDADADAGPAPVTVQVINGLAPVAGRLVFFHDATGAVIESATTGADGRASSKGATPAEVTVALGDAKGHAKRLLTWTAVAAGDVLVAADSIESQPAGTVDAVLPGAFAAAPATNYIANIGNCSGSTQNPDQPVTIYMTTECLGAKNAVLARATAGVGNDALGYAFKKGNALPTDGGTGSVTVGAWAAPTGVTLTAANPPAGPISPVLVEVADGQAFPNYTGGGFDGATANLKVASGFADAFQIGVRADDTANGGSVLVGKRGAPATAVTIDMAQALPFITDVTSDTTDARRPKLTWTSVAPLTASDGGSVALGWFDTNEDNFSWTFVVPPSATDVKAPALPKEADAWLPSDPDAGGAQVFFQPPEALFAESDLMPDYATFRAGAGVVIPGGDPYDRAIRAVLPKDGTLRASWFYLIPR